MKFSFFIGLLLVLLLQVHATLIDLTGSDDENAILERYPEQKAQVNIVEYMDLDVPEYKADPETIEYAEEALLQISNNLLAYRIEDLAEKLFALGDAEIKKSLKVGSRWNLLHQAVYEDNLEVAELLIETFRFDPNSWDNHFGTCAYLVSSVRMVKLLLSLGTDFKIHRDCFLYSSPEDSALMRNNPAFYASFTDFEARFEYFHSMQTHFQTGNGRMKLKASRDKMYEYALGIIGKFTDNKMTNAHINIAYLDEVGVDQGGLTSEFVCFMKDEMIRGGRVFETDPETGYLNFKADAPANEAKLAGFLVGLSIFHKSPLNVVFVPIIYELILQARNPHRGINFVSVLKETSETVMRGLEVVKGYNEEMLGMVDFPSAKGDELRPWKRRREVVGTRDNISDYIRVSAKEVVYNKRAAVYDQFLLGLRRTIDYSQISSYLNTEELKIVIRGSSKDYTAQDWQEHHGEFENQEAFQLQYTWLFEIIDELTPLQRRQLLKFFASLECLPVGGLASLEKKISVTVLVESNNPDRELPQAATCTNTLKIFPYTSKAIMKRNLIAAIENCGGFFLL